MIVDLTVPAVGESITEGTLASWSVENGSYVIEGQALFELETDKTTLDVTAPATGVLKQVVTEGSDVTVDQVVGRIDTDTQASQELTVPENQVETIAPSVVNKVSPPLPAAQSAAAEKEVNPFDLQGSGRGGRVTKEDVLSAKTRPPQVLPKSEVAPATSLPPSDDFRARREPLSRIRRAIAVNLKETQRELVLLTTFNEADMGAAKALRARWGEAFKERHGVKLGFMSLFLKACAESMRHYPTLNARIEGNDVVHADGVHIAVAVSSSKGLLTPVLRYVDRKGFADIEGEISSFARRAEDKSLMPEELSGGTFAVTNGGIFGSLLSTPLPAPGQSAILGMHAIQDRPVARDGQVVIRPIMSLALTYDHRLVDGREAVGFLKTVKESVENPERLLLEI